MRIGFDVDGVLACFYKGYEDLVIEIAGEDKFGPHKWPMEIPCTWNWPEHYGYSKDTITKAWQHIKVSRDFWLKLIPMHEWPEMRDVIMDIYYAKHQVYFITDRPGETAKQQTEQWLNKLGVIYPTVIISRKGKGIVCAALDLELYIDDKGENIVDVDTVSPSTQGILLNRPYNQHVTVNRRMDTLGEALRLIR